MNDDIRTEVDIDRTIEISILDRCWSAVINPFTIQDMRAFVRGAS